MTGEVHLEPVHRRPTFTDAVNASADLPFDLTVWTVVDVLQAPDHLRVTASRRELAVMSFGETQQLGITEAAAELGRRAREAYEARIERAESA